MPLCHSASALGRLAASRQYIQSAAHKRASLWTVGLDAYTPSPSEDSNSTIHTASCSRYMSTNTSLSSSTESIWMATNNRFSDSIHIDRHVYAYDVASGIAS
ncbi:hypothetical protein BASA83_007015 [Batrachochytrium salamandrivorans]|nr:hypothetical protein BASA83_007015 [Batrachochytrium salamandrivorans]